MRKHFYKLFVCVLLIAAMSVSTIPVFAADVEAVGEGNDASVEVQTTEPVVETITIENQELWEGKIPADLSWKTKQDKGQWIEELGLSEGINSLVLVINSLDKEDPDALPTQEAVERAEKAKLEQEANKNASQKSEKMKKGNIGQSQLLYLAKNAEGEWIEILSSECVISGGEIEANESIYGIYKPKQAFGNMENPGSLISYRNLTKDDYWILNPGSSDFGDIYTASSQGEVVVGAVNLSAQKVFFNYGMIVQAEDEEQKYPSLLLNCQQDFGSRDKFAGIQIPESTLRMLIQCIDENTSFVIVGSVDELTDLPVKNE